MAGHFIHFTTPDNWAARIWVTDSGEMSYSETIVTDPEYGTLRFGDAGAIDPKTGEIDLSQGSRLSKTILEQLLEINPNWLDS